MRRMHVALLTNALWLAAVMGGAVLLHFGENAPVTLAGAAGLIALAGAGSMVIGGRADRRASAELAALGAAAGLDRTWTPAKALTLETLVGSLVKRLERATSVKAAFGQLVGPAFLMTVDGEVLAVTQGLRALVPFIEEGDGVETVMNPRVVLGGGAKEAILVAVAGRRWEVSRRPAGPMRVLVEMRPAGHVIADDDLDAFTEALASGRSSFRFDDEAVAQSSALAMLNQTLERFDMGEGAPRGAVFRTPLPPPHSGARAA